MKTVLLVHVPYDHRGGEDTHVEYLAHAYRSIGYEVLLFPEDRKPPGMNPSLAARSLLPSFDASTFRRDVETSQVSLIHIHNVFPSLGPRFMRGLKALKLPIVMTIHNHRFFCSNGLALRKGRICKDCFSAKLMWRPFLYNCNQNWLKSAYYGTAISQIRLQRILNKVNIKFLAPSPYIQGELIRFGIESERVKLLLNPVGPAELDPMGGQVADLNLKWDCFYAGRLSHEKGIAGLIGTIRRLPHLRFAIAGDGPLRAQVESAVREVKNLQYLGALSLADVHCEIKRTKISILPSVCNEILPTFVLESFFFGKRCVLPDLDSTRWLSSSPFPGVAVQTSETESMAQGIQFALTLPLLCQGELNSLRMSLGFGRFCRELKDHIGGLV